MQQSIHGLNIDDATQQNGRLSTIESVACGTWEEWDRFLNLEMDNNTCELTSFDDEKINHHRESTSRGDGSSIALASSINLAYACPTTNFEGAIPEPHYSSTHVEPTVAQQLTGGVDAGCHISNSPLSNHAIPEIDSELWPASSLERLAGFDSQYHPGSLPATSLHDSHDSQAALPALDSGFGSTSLLGPAQTTPPMFNLDTQRTLPRRKSRYAIRGRGTNVAPSYISNPQFAADPLQRWQDSPPEDEPASLSAIMESLRKFPPTYDQESSHGIGTASLGPLHDSFKGYRHRTTSIPSSQSSAHSVSSQPSSTSAKSATSRKSQGPIRSSKKRATGRVRKGRSAKMNPGEKGRLFCCTFCCDQFRTKYDWARHEKSLHLNLEEWVCAPQGGTVVSPSTGRRHCSFCNMPDPTAEHLNGHKYEPCMGGTRTFRRKDHLVQHLRRTHHLETLPQIDDWKVQGPPVTSRCGFCDQRLSSWEERVDHLGNHFRSGSTMDDWRGDHDFPPAIAKLVVNSLPPYHIASDSRVLVPFSATNFHHYDHLNQIKSRLGASELNAPDHELNADSQLGSFGESASAGSGNDMIEVLVFHLSRFARQQMDKGIIPTDEMLQQESRRLVYDCEDSWNQTIFDNPKWIAAFRRQHIDQVADSERDGMLHHLDGFSLHEDDHGPKLDNA